MDAILQRDYPIIQGVVLVGAFIFIVVNLIMDLIYAWINPRIRDEMMGKNLACIREILFLKTLHLLAG